MSRTIADLIRAYRADENSGLHKLSYKVRYSFPEKPSTLPGPT